MPTGGGPQREFAGQQTSIANEIKRNLENYADTQLFTELAQNADDAGATRVAFMLDHRIHGTEKVYGGKMASLQGPALLSFNDSVFSERDFTGLFNFGRGSKRFDPTKTGKFGLGFNTCYHITEVPMFVSGDYMMVLDPQRHFYPGLDDVSKPPGMRTVIAKEDSRALFDQFAPFCQPDMCGCNLQRNPEFKGTLFRFPLRTAEHAKTSELNNTPCSMETVEKLFQIFEEKASRMLLFIQNLEQIEFWDWQDGAPKAKCFYRVKLTGAGQARKMRVQWLRSNLDAWSKKSGKDWKITDGALQDSLRSITPSSAPRQSIHVTLELSKPQQGWQVKQDWWIRQGVGLKESWQLALSPEVANQTVWPCAGVAACASSDFGGLGERATHVHLPTEGLVFTTVPTNIKTELPVHVDACFLLSDNRRQLATSDSYGNQIKSKWNRCLIAGALSYLSAPFHTHIARS